MMNSKQLKRRCRQNWVELTQGMEIRGDETNRHAFKDNGGSILAVAHTDFVSKTEHFQHLFLDNGHHIFNGQLDDRLGVYTILDVLPALGVKVDVLLTDLEEVGASTAGDFVASKDYNWMFQFDRRGIDSVVYDFESKDWKSALSKNLKLGQGTFSDICKLEHLGCCGVNVGTGYYNEHTSWHHMVVKEWEDQVKRFNAFYHAFHDHKFEHVQKPKFDWSDSWKNKAWKWDKESKRYLMPQESSAPDPWDQDIAYFNKAEEERGEYRLYCWECNLWVDEDDAFSPLDKKSGVQNDNLRCPVCSNYLEREWDDEMVSK